VLRLLRAALCLGLSGSGRTPKGTGIGSIRVKLEHPVIELAGGFCRVVQLNEVADVLARFLHVFRTVIVAGNLGAAPKLVPRGLLTRRKPITPRST
jgi:hypothetical protein